MSEIYFVLKAFALTVAIVFIMQIRVGNTTLEEKSLSWLHHAGAVEALRGVADGGVLAVTRGVHWVVRSSEDLYEKQFGNHKKNDSRKDWEREATRPHGDEVD